MVSETRRALERPKTAGRLFADVERLCRPPKFRRVLATPGGFAVSHARHRSDYACSRLVGSGGFLRAADDLRGAGKARCRESKFLRRRPVESRRLESNLRTQAG